MNQCSAELNPTCNGKTKLPKPKNIEKIEKPYNSVVYPFIIITPSIK